MKRKGYQVTSDTTETLDARSRSLSLLSCMAALYVLDTINHEPNSNLAPLLQEVLQPFVGGAVRVYSLGMKPRD